VSTTKASATLIVTDGLTTTSATLTGIGVEGGQIDASLADLGSDSDVLQASERPASCEPLPIMGLCWCTPTTTTAGQVSVSKFCFGGNAGCTSDVDCPPVAPRCNIQYYCADGTPNSGICTPLDPSANQC
jgi:hypothetical protein